MRIGTKPIRLGSLTVDPSASITGVRWVDATVHTDDRGYFFEGYREDIYHSLSGDVSVQTNISVSKPMVLRGFHYHEKQIDFWAIASGMAQVVVASGGYFDSKVLGPGQGVIINQRIGHGFLALSDLVLVYNVTEEHDAIHPDEHGFSAHMFEGWLCPIDQTIRSQRDIGYDNVWTMP